MPICICRDCGLNWLRKCQHVVLMTTIDNWGQKPLYYIMLNESQRGLEYGSQNYWYGELSSEKSSG